MKKIYKNGDTRIRAQGDVIIIRLDAMDKELTFNPLTEKLVVAHSESGHNHVIVKDREAELEFAQDEGGYFLKVKSGTAQIVHEKVGGHEPHTLEKGLYYFQVQFEYNELADRKVQD